MRRINGSAVSSGNFRLYPGVCKDNPTHKNLEPDRVAGKLRFLVLFSFVAERSRGLGNDYYMEKGSMTASFFWRRGVFEGIL